MAAFDFTSLTLGEINYIESMGGQPISAFDDDTLPKGKPLAAVAVVLKRRSGQPDFNINLAMDLPMSEVLGLMGVDTDADDEDESEDASGEENAFGLNVSD